jgi:hypothetical protein
MIEVDKTFFNLKVILFEFPFPFRAKRDIRLANILQEVV